MTEVDFRQQHSELIGWYQLIEMRLRGICAALLTDEDRTWFDGLEIYETDAFGKLIHEIQALQTKKQIEYLIPEDIKNLSAIREERNYWVHQCFIGDTPITFSHGLVRKNENSIKLHRDLQNAIEWDEKLTNIFRKIADAKNLIG